VKKGEQVALLRHHNGADEQVPLYAAEDAEQAARCGGDLT
jgi:hypothetical protein